MQNLNDPKIIVALDFPSQNPALALADQLDPAKCRLKVGKEAWARKASAVGSRPVHPDPPGGPAQLPW